MKFLVAKIVGLIVVFATACKSTRLITPKLDMNDSLAVVNYIAEHDICDKIRFVQTNKKQFIDNVGFSKLILFSVIKQAKTPIYIPYGSQRGYMNLNDIEVAIQEQLDSLKVNSNCQ